MKVTASATPTKWDEKPYDQGPSAMRMTKASVEYTYHGGIEGVGLTEYVMFYQEFNASNPHAATATYVGLTRFKGTMNGKSGSVVLEERGSFAGGTARTTVTILPGSGTGELAGISGSGASTATATGAGIELEYSLP